MRSFIALGIVSLVAGAGMISCSDDDPSRGPGLGGSANAGSGGTGTGGTGTGGTGTGGTAAGGTGTGGTGGGAGGAGGSGGAGPDVSPLATCSGCVELIAPVVGPRSPDNVADEASYIFSLGAPVDFSDGVITWRIAAVQPNDNYVIVLFAQNGQALNFAGAYAELALGPAAFPANEFREVVLDLSGVPPAPGDAGAPDASTIDDDGPDDDDPDAGLGATDAGDAGGALTPPPTVIDAFDKSQIIQLGIFVGVNEAFTGSATVRVAVDQVTISGVPGQPDRTFTSGTENLAINQYNVPPGTPAPVFHP